MLFLLDANIRDYPGDVPGVTLLLSFLFLPFANWANLFIPGMCVYGSICGLTLTLVVHPGQYQTSSLDPQERPQEG